MSSSNDEIMLAIKKLAKQNYSLQKALNNIQQDNYDLRREHTDLLDTLKMFLEDKNDDRDITWSANIINEKTNIPLKQIKKAMRTGDLPSIPIHKRGKGYVRVTSPENVKSWLQKKNIEHEKTKESRPEKTKSQLPRRKPPNIVF